MNNKFKEWHDKKSNIEQKDKRVFFHEREVWWCSLGENIGFEQNGKGSRFARPVIVFQKFNNETFWAVPLTTKGKVGKFYLPINLDDGMKRFAVLSQLRLCDAKRLYQKIDVISYDLHDTLVKSIIGLCNKLKR